MKTFVHIHTLIPVFLVTILLSGGPVLAVKHLVLVGNFFFNPSNITDVEVGDTIRWQWVEGMHTTTSTAIPAGATNWDSPINNGNQVFEYNVTVPGTYNYHCTPHSSIQQGSFTASEPALYLTVTPDNQHVTYIDGATLFTVTTNTDWVAESDVSWCSVTPGGSGNGTITATYTENPAAGSRTAQITVTGDGPITQVVTVTQDGSGLGIESLAERAFRIYPNPTSGVFTLIPREVSNLNMELCVLDLTGKVLHEEILSGATSYRFNISHLPEGLYFVRLKDGEKTATQRVVRSSR